MQPAQDRKKRLTLYLIIIGAFIVFGLILYFAGALGGGTRSVAAEKLRCVSTQSVTPFGDRVLYYDGTTLFCLSSGGRELWNYAIGTGAGFHVSEDGYLAAWVGNQLYIIDRNGRSSYNDRLSDTVQFARAGGKYVAAILGSGAQPSLVVKDMDGITVDSETAAYEDKLILDLGFFGGGEYLWTTSIDLYGVNPDVTFNTYKVGQLNTGETSLGESLTYAVVYAGGKLNVVNTRQLRRYDYRCVLDTSASLLVYGWELADSYVPASGDAYLLFTPSLQSSATGAISELRLIQGSRTDKRYTLPSACVGAALRNKTIYAFSASGLYRADVSSSRFTAFSLPMPTDATGYIGMLTNGVALIACGSDVYAVSLP